MASASNTRQRDDGFRERLFLEKIQYDPDGCWRWTAYINGSGYGHFFSGERDMGAHRWAYLHFVGEIPDGLQIDHLCKHPYCVNPSHLEAVTPRENLERGRSLAFRKELTHCPSGHPYSGENLYAHPITGHRVCKACGTMKKDAIIKRYLGSPNYRGGRKGHLKAMTDEEEAAVCRRRTNGERAIELAVEYGVSISQIYTVARQMKMEAK